MLKYFQSVFKITWINSDFDDAYKFFSLRNSNLINRFYELLIGNNIIMIEILNKPNEMVRGKRALGEKQQNIYNLKFSVQNLSARFSS